MALGRPRTFDPDVAVQSAMECFWSNGFEATSMQNLLERTGLSKSSLYESFGSKRGLFERCLTRYRDDCVAAMTRRLADSRNGLTFIKDMLESVASEGRTGTPRGCLVMNTAGEFSQKDPGMARLVEQSIAAFSEVFRRAVKQAQTEGAIPQHKNPARLARFIVTNMSGLRTLAKAGVDPRALVSTARDVVDALRD